MKARKVATSHAAAVVAVAATVTVVSAKVLRAWKVQKLQPRQRSPLLRLKVKLSTPLRRPLSSLRQQPRLLLLLLPLNRLLPKPPPPLLRRVRPPRLLQVQLSRRQLLPSLSLPHRLQLRQLKLHQLRLHQQPLRFNLQLWTCQSRRQPPNRSPPLLLRRKLRCHSPSLLLWPPNRQP